MNSLTIFETKKYQQQVLDSIEKYFKACYEFLSPSVAFTATTESLWGRGLPWRGCRLGGRRALRRGPSLSGADRCVG